MYALMGGKERDGREIFGESAALHGLLPVNLPLARGIKES